MPYKWMHYFFKFIARVNPRINALTFKTENSKTLTYNFDPLTVWKSDYDIIWSFPGVFNTVFFIPVHFSLEFTPTTPDERLDLFLA